MVVVVGAPVAKVVKAVAVMIAIVKALITVVF